MAMTEQERVDLGSLIAARRKVRFNQKKAAYVKAGVNSQTWDKAEAGLSIRDDNLRTIVRTLWPETEGEWSRIPVGPQEQDAGYVASPGERAQAGVTDDEVLREIRAMRDDVRELSERVARIEQQGP